MRILFLTWKDIKHPHKGGAESVMFDYMKHLASFGHEVVWYASGFPGATPEELIDGIRVVRAFNIRSIYFLTWKWYKEFSKTWQPDVIVDEAGWIPLFSFLFEKKIPILFFAHHVGDKEWDFAFPFPINQIGKWIYRKIFWLYRKHQAVAVSNSTKCDLVEIGFPAGNVHVIDDTINAKPIERIDFAEKQDWIVFVGRLMPMKRVEESILAFSKLLPKYPGYRLKIIGNMQDQAYVGRAKLLTESLGIANAVDFLGSLPINEKDETVRKSRFWLVTSYKEWYGLVVVEAASLGTPVIGYDVHGIRDSIVEGVDGHKVPDGDHGAIADTIARYLENPAEYERLANSALEYTKGLPSWKDQSKRFESLLQQLIHPSHGTEKTTARFDHPTDQE